MKKRVSNPPLRPVQQKLIEMLEQRILNSTKPIEYRRKNTVQEAVRRAYL